MEPLDQILDAPVSPQQELRYAGFWIRVAAYLIDYVLMIVLVLILGFSVGSLGQFAIFLVYIVVYVGYMCGFESSEKQATPGKMAVGIKVGKANGDKISFANALGRLLGKILSGFFFCIGYMMVGWDDRKQGIHDKLADTYVFYGQ